MGKALPNKSDDVERLFRALLLIHRAQERITQDHPAKRIKSPVHLSIGQEAVGLRGVLGHDEIVAMSHRGHAAYAATGARMTVYGPDRPVAA